MSDRRIETWMFRYPGEYFALFICICLFVGVGVVFSTFNVYIFIGLVILGLIYIRLQQTHYLGNSIRLHSAQSPEIYNIFKKHALALEIRKANIYITQDPNLNAFALGYNTCSVVLTSALVEQFSMKELSFIIGHELGHFKAGHTKLSTLISPLGQDNILSTLVFGIWQRKCEYTSDRCGLTLTKDIDSCISALIKLTIGGVLYKELNIEGYISQLRKAQGVSITLSELVLSHPLTSNRIINSYKFWKENFTRNEMS